MRPLHKDDFQSGNAIPVSHLFKSYLFCCAVYFALGWYLANSFSAFELLGFFERTILQARIHELIILSQISIPFFLSGLAAAFFAFIFALITIIRRFKPRSHVGTEVELGTPETQLLIALIAFPVLQYFTIFSSLSSSAGSVFQFSIFFLHPMFALFAPIYGMASAILIFNIFAILLGNQVTKK